MKIAFSTRHVTAPSFVSICNTANEYGYAGIELTGQDMDGHKYPDGLWGSDRVGAKRKLVNRHLAVSALFCETPIFATEEDGKKVEAYVLAASKAGIANVVLTIGENTVIGAGSVVTRDIPANVVAVGSPCRVVREIGERDREYYFRDRRIPAEIP